MIPFRSEVMEKSHCTQQNQQSSLWESSSRWSEIEPNEWQSGGSEPRILQLSSPSPKSKVPKSRPKGLGLTLKSQDYHRHWLLHHRHWLLHHRHWLLHHRHWLHPITPRLWPLHHRLWLHSPYCQAQVQSPKSQSQDSKDLGWHNNHKTTIDSGSYTIDSGSYTIDSGSHPITPRLWLLYHRLWLHSPITRALPQPNKTKYFLLQQEL